MSKQDIRSWEVTVMSADASAPSCGCPLGRGVHAASGPLNGRDWKTGKYGGEA